MGVTPITNMDEFKKAINSGKPVIIDCWAEWCGPCRFISPVFEKLSETYPAVAFYKVDVDAVQDVSQELGIRAMPTFSAFKDGQKVNELVGADPNGLNNLVSAVAELA